MHPHTHAHPYFFLPLSSLSLVPLVESLLEEVMHSWPLRPSSLMMSPPTLSRRRLLFMMLRTLSLPLNPLPLLLHLLLLEYGSLSLPLWINFSSCVLILVVVLTIFLMRCVRWTPGLVALLADSLVARWQSRLSGFAPSSSPELDEESSASGDDKCDDVCGSTHDDEMIDS